MSATSIRSLEVAFYPWTVTPSARQSRRPRRRVVTNQSGSRAATSATRSSRRPTAHLGPARGHGARVDAYYYCPHHPGGTMAACEAVPVPAGARLIEVRGGSRPRPVPVVRGRRPAVDVQLGARGRARAGWWNRERRHRGSAAAGRRGGRCGGGQSRRRRQLVLSIGQSEIVNPNLQLTSPQQC